MTNEIPLLATVALTIDLPAERLTRGQIGTVVEHLQSSLGSAELVEFADAEGETYAMIAVQAKDLLVLHRRHRAA